MENESKSSDEVGCEKDENCSIIENQLELVDYTEIFTTDQVFNSRESLIEWAQNKGRNNGLVIVIKKSDVNVDRRRPRISFACERSGVYKKKNNESQKPKRFKATGTKKCDCPFLLKGLKLESNDDWMLKVICGVHNHHAANHLEGHSYVGRLTKEEFEILVDMSKSNVKSKDILLTLKGRDENNATTMTTIYNARRKFKFKELCGRSQMQQLLSKLADYNYVEWHRINEDTGSVRDLFWAHPLAIELLRAFPRVLIMDCTYKTNKYRFPLLEIVGVTSTEMTFSVAFVFLENERVDNYTWALEKLKTIMDENMLPSVILTDREIALMNAIQNVFPNASNLLCRWHISRNVLAHCKKLFETNEKWETFICSWNVLVLSSTKQEYIHNLSLMEGEFSNYPIALDYVKQAWLDKYKEKFVAAWTDLVMHLGNSTTNRAESSHSQLKRQLGSSQGNFLTSWTKIHGLLQLQHNEIKASFERSLTLVQHSFKPSDFKELRGFVSRNALNMILDEYERVDSNDAICSCVVRLTHGLPCAHEISGYKRECRPIPLSSIHSHWRKLDLVPTIGNESPKLNCKVEMEMIEKRFDKIDDGSKLQLLKKLKELANPASTSLIEPEVKCNTRGRPPTKHDTSTRRDPSMFEYVLSTQGNHSPSLMSLSTNAVHSKRREKLKEVKSQTFKPISFIDSFPVGLRPYIRDVKDVLGDGNCGFRVVASWMDIGDDNWIQVRRDLIDELQQHYDYYTQLFGYSDRAKEVMNSLSYVEANPGIDYWMTMPDTGHLIASKYNVVLLLISQRQCLTFLPLRSIPLPRSSHKNEKRIHLELT